MATSSRTPASLLLLLLLLFFASFLAFVSSDLTKDRAECTDQLIGLATCLSYVEGGTAMAPTPDCCSSAKIVVDKSMKCLCVLIKDRNDQALGIKFNITRVLMLPSKCSFPADISQCPGLLNIPKNSPEGKDFEQLANELKEIEARENGSKAGGNESKAKGSANESVTPVTNTSNGSSKVLLGITMASGAWIFSLIYFLFIC